MKNILRLIVALFCFFAIDYVVDHVLKYGLDKGMGLNEHSKMLIVGHSHLMMGLDRTMLENRLGCKVTKHTRSGVGMGERKLMVQMFLNSPYSDSLKIVVIGVDPFSFNGKGISENCYTLFYPWMDDKEVGRYISGETEPADYYVHKFFHLSRYSDDLIKQSIRGWRCDDRNYKTSVFTDSIFNGNKAKWARSITFNRQLMAELEQTISLCVERKVHVVLFQAPVLKLLTDLHHKDYVKILSYYHHLDDSSEYVHFINYSPFYDKNYNIFFDPIHLNVNGQKIVTEKFIKDISPIIYK